MPNVGIRTVVGSGGIPYARILMSNHLNRVLDKDEVVHHIDGDPSNDDISNLRIVSRSEHTSLHKMGNTYKRGTSNSIEQNERISRALTGRKVPKESVELMRKSLTGRSLSEEHKAKISASLVGRPRSKETRRSIADSLQRTREINKMHWSEEVIAEAMKGEENV